VGARGRIWLIAAWTIRFRGDGDVALGVGSSTGGFTDVLLSRGAAKVSRSMSALAARLEAAQRSAGGRP
jgi:predicted rRNA methylase YqxC with S4 and FtsJ domains